MADEVKYFALDEGDDQKLQQIVRRLYDGTTLSYDARRDLAAQLQQVLDRGYPITLPANEAPAPPTPAAKTFQVSLSRVRSVCEAAMLCIEADSPAQAAAIAEFVHDGLPDEDLGWKWDAESTDYDSTKAYIDGETPDGEAVEEETAKLTTIPMADLRLRITIV